jgi:hypothetical protein
VGDDALSPATVVLYRVPRAVVAASAEALRTLSNDRIEAVVLWQGRVRSRRTAEVCELVVPRQRAGALHFDVPLEERMRLIDVVTAAGDIILAQLHTHPREAFHSAADDRLAIPQHVGGISIVVPDFGQYWDGDFGAASVHRHLGGARWEELSLSVARHLFEVT